MTKYVFPGPFQIPFMLSNFKWPNVFSIKHLFWRLKLYLYLWLSKAIWKKDLILLTNTVPANDCFCSPKWKSLSAYFSITSHLEVDILKRLREAFAHLFKKTLKAILHSGCSLFTNKQKQFRSQKPPWKNCVVFG